VNRSLALDQYLLALLIHYELRRIDKLIVDEKVDCSLRVLVGAREAREDVALLDFFYG